MITETAPVAVAVPHVVKTSGEVTDRFPSHAEALACVRMLVGTTVVDDGWSVKQIGPAWWLLTNGTDDTDQVTLEVSPDVAQEAE